MRNDFEGQTCGIYPRVSTKKQAKSDKTSLKDQEIACRDYADDLGMIVEEACVKPEAFTSTQMDRPELNELLHKMQAQHVPNLIIDTADRMTREGQLAAAQFLHQFIRVGITLHVVSMNLVVNDDKGIKDFLDAAYQAQQDNLQRARKSKRTKRSRAKAGIFNRGNHAPYGYRWIAVAHDDDGNPTDRKLVPDERTYAERGFHTLFALTPYATRKEIVRLYAQEGLSSRVIADKLNAAHVPTAASLMKWSGTTGQWWNRSVTHIINDPLNRGILINTFMDDDKQPQQIIVNSVHGNPEPIVDEQTAALLTLRKERGRAASINRNSIHRGKYLLVGGLAVCGLCGSSVRVHGVKYHGQYYRYYQCNRHHNLSTACPGVHLNVQKVDPWAWRDVVGALTQLTYTAPTGKNDVDYIDMLVYLEAKRVGKTPSAVTDLAALRKSRDQFMVDAETLALEIVRAQSQLARDLLQRQLDRLEPEIEKANRLIAEEERQRTNRAQRAQVLGSFLRQWRLYSGAINSLDAHYEEDLPIMAALLRAVGAKVTLQPDMFTKANELDQEPEVGVEITLSPMSALPWKTPEEMQALIDERRSRRVSSPYGFADTPATDDDCFALTGSSPAQSAQDSAAPIRRNSPGAG